MRITFCRRWWCRTSDPLPSLCRRKNAIRIAELAEKLRVSGEMAEEATTFDDNKCATKNRALWWNHACRSEGNMVLESDVG